MKSLRVGRASLLPGLIGALAVAACTVGPNYVRPTIPVAPSYSDLADKDQAPLGQTTSAPPDEAAIARWWERFNDPVLNDLVARALKANLDIEADYARIRQAREQVVVAGAAGLPQANLNGVVAQVNENSSNPTISNAFGGSLSNASGAAAGANATSAPSRIDLFSPAFDATWEVDVFGGVRRSVEANTDTVQAMIWAKRDAEVSLTSELTTDYLELRVQQALLAIAQSELKSERNLLKIIQDQRDTGFVNRLNVNTQEGQVQATIASVPAIEAQVRVEIHAIGVLLGVDPEALEPQLSSAGDRPLPGVPTTLPVGLPSDLLRRRPDVQRAERQLASATAQVGVQVANLYPKFNVLALGATAANSFSGAFDADAATSVGAAIIQWPVFQGGRLRAGIRSARAQQDQAYFAYKKTVLIAIQNAEDALSRYSSDQRRLLAQQASLKATVNSLLIARQQYAVGLVTFVNVLTSEQNELNARNMLDQDQGQLATDLVSLFKALGGGWSADEQKDLSKPGISYP